MMIRLNESTSAYLSPFFRDLLLLRLLDGSKGGSFVFPDALVDGLCWLEGL